MSLLDILRKGEKPAETEDPRPRGGSGRGHTSGFLELEELNIDLAHPQGHRKFDQMYRTDADVSQVIRLSINPILAGTWQVQPYGGEDATARDQEIADDLKWAVNEYMRPNLVGHLAQFLPVLLRSGFVPGEKTWAVADRNGKKFLVPRSIGLRLPRSVNRWHQDDAEQLVAIEQFLYSGGATSYQESGQYVWGGGSGGDSSGVGGMVRIERKDLVYYRVGAEGDNWEGVSLLRPAYKHWYLKDVIERVDAIAQEREAMGVPVCYPPASATPKQLTEMEELLGRMRVNEQGFIIMPGMKAGAGASDNTGWLLELLGFDRSGSGRDPHPSLTYHSNKIAAAFIAEFMRLGHGSSGGGGGAKALGQVQADPFLMSVEALATVVEQELHDSITLPFVAYNYADVDQAPKIKMSLVDSTSLSALADFVLKLTQVGALLPDQELEDFLRARADMPPANPIAVKARGQDEEMIRRAIVGGNIEQTPAEKDAASQAIEQAKVAPPGGGFGGGAKKPGGNKQDPYGSNAKVGKHKNGKPSHASGHASGPGSGGAGTPRGEAKQMSLDDVAYDARVAGLNDTSRWWEMHVDLDDIDQTMDSMPDQMLEACSSHVYALARGEKAEGLQGSIQSVLDDAYAYGAQTVDDELAAQGHDGKFLDRGARDRGGALGERAGHAAAAVEHAVAGARLGQDLAHGREGASQGAAETAGLRALRRVGHDHGIAAIQHGRHDRGAELSQDTGIQVRYSAVLDDGTCHDCALCDDGQARDLDDPVRLERQPPNPECASLDSGFNRCRCIEIYETATPDDGPTLSAESPSTMPPWLSRVMATLIARGMPMSRALQVAHELAKHVVATGKVNWPGLKSIGAGDQAGAAEALRWWATHTG